MNQLAVYADFFSLVCDPDPKIQKNAIISIIEASKSHPRYFFQFMTEKLSFSDHQLLSKEYFGSHIDLLTEFIKTSKPEIIREGLDQIYAILKEIIDVFFSQLDCPYSINK